MNGLVKKGDAFLTSEAEKFLEKTRVDLIKVAQLFFEIGYELNKAVANGYVGALGYSDIYELSEAEFGLKKTRTKTFMAINRRFGENGMSGLLSPKLAKEFEKFNQSQLVELLPLSNEKIKEVSETMSVSDIRIYKKACSCSYGAYAGDTPEEKVKEYKRIHNSIPKEKPDNVEPEPPKRKKSKYVAPTVIIKKEEKKAEGPCPGQISIEEAFCPEDIYPGQTSDRKMNRFQKLRKERGLSQVELGRSLNVKQNTISGWETNASFPSNSTLKNLAKFFGVTLDYLFGGDNELDDAKELSDASVVAVDDEPKRFCFDTDDERKSFIENVANYTEIVMSSPELGLYVRKLTFSNGAIVYRTEFFEYEKNGSHLEQRIKFHLVDKSTERHVETMPTICPMSYTLEGTPIEYIVEYMATYKDEI